MSEPLVTPFSARSECDALFRACLARSAASLQLFDPDYSVFPLGAAEVDAALRAFLRAGGTLQLALHTTSYIERHYPRFLRLLRDYGQRAECRVTPRSLRALTDSFCIGDASHIVRRFHSEHPRGEAAFGAPAATELARQRFSAIWSESAPVLQGGPAGL
jgi:hypothetical protein